MNELIDVLDHGYVTIRAATPESDLSVVNAARASFDRDTDILREKDQRLIYYLAKHDHTSPFRHAFFTFEIKAPLLVARQWWKYVTGSDHTMDSWNEVSFRYVTPEEPEFYVPTEWRRRPEGNVKQGSGELLDPYVGKVISKDLQDATDEALGGYRYALAQGVAPEQARLFLPAYAMYTRWRWSCSLQSLGLFLKQRLADDAQYEIREYAKAVQVLATPHAPYSLAALLNR